MTFSITIDRYSGSYEIVPIEAKTARKAMAAMREYMASVPAEDDAYLTWYRPSDGQHGYINPSGDFAINGTPWKQEAG